MARLRDLLADLFGLAIGEGAPAQTSAIKARLMAGTALACDETGPRG